MMRKSYWHGNSTIETIKVDDRLLRINAQALPLPYSMPCDLEIRSEKMTMGGRTTDKSLHKSAERTIMMGTPLEDQRK